MSKKKANKHKSLKCTKKKLVNSLTWKAAVQFVSVVFNIAKAIEFIWNHVKNIL